MRTSIRVATGLQRPTYLRVRLNIESLVDADEEGSDVESSLSAICLLLASFGGFAAAASSEMATLWRLSRATPRCSTSNAAADLLPKGERGCAPLASSSVGVDLCRKDAACAWPAEPSASFSAKVGRCCAEACCGRDALRSSDTRDTPSCLRESLAASSESLPLLLLALKLTEKLISARFVVAVRRRLRRLVRRSEFVWFAYHRLVGVWSRGFARGFVGDSWLRFAA